ncbi:flagellar protein FlgN [Blastopirellula sp. JC732]|uniref:Flagellar protein FlgN n=1 Tax=Blastopirellula sediminis TaxID=2894196 RepID=A0A9X1SHB5_9BACT|nr:flagellar protein FlgN [Blastopirellula sediminis]MCC9605685.1 flagellar protein FlgN [Blastopirellula sediminis]MCC9631015.1 flagellar protein FlgN [Blastopirellula sediminis]
MHAYAETDELVQLIAQKHDLLSKLQLLSRRQLQLSGHSDHITDLMRVVAAKQTLIEMLLNVDRQLDPHRLCDPESRHWRSPLDRHRCSEATRECQAMLDELKQLESEAEQRVRTNRDEISRSLQMTQGSTVALDGYASTSGPTHRIDFTAG